MPPVFPQYQYIVQGTYILISLLCNLTPNSKNKIFISHYCLPSLSSISFIVIPNSFCWVNLVYLTLKYTENYYLFQQLHTVFLSSIVSDSLRPYRL